MTTTVQQSGTAPRPKTPPKPKPVKTLKQLAVAAAGNIGATDTAGTLIVKQADGTVRVTVLGNSVRGTIKLMTEATFLLADKFLGDMTDAPASPGTAQKAA